MKKCLFVCFFVIFCLFLGFFKKIDLLFFTYSLANSDLFIFLQFNLFRISGIALVYF